MPIHRIDGTLYVDDVSLRDIARFAGTPAYVYSWETIRNRVALFTKNFEDIPHRTYFAVKANSNLALLKRLADLGCGFDIVSGGELERVLHIGAKPSDIVFSGVGKLEEELSFALKCLVGCINIESTSEFEKIRNLANILNTRANVALRVNPGIDADTHPYIATALATSKFGLQPVEAIELANRIVNEPSLNLVGIACHLGSQISEVAPYESGLTELLSLLDQLEENGISVPNLNIGGGFGITYEAESELSLVELSRVIAKCVSGRNLTLCMEPGRFLVGHAGVLLTKVLYTKIDREDQRPNFAIVDAAMNDLLRPALYDAWHTIETVHPNQSESRKWNIVGPICESGDFLGLERTLSLGEDDLLAIRDVGAYGFVLSSNYNSRPRCAEVLVDGSDMHLIRTRETMNDLLRLERLV